ncbi:carbohydrate ABC transporter permease [Horticoccus luteus]|nr:carbohydrate ABC transporter permease [Horticoccus luteus]
MRTTDETLTKPLESLPARVRHWSGGMGLHGVMTVLSLAMILPFAWMVLTSLKTLAEAADPAWLPHTAQWGNYPEVFRVIPFLRFAANSLVVAGWVTLLQVFTSALAAYSFARLDWPGRDRVFFIYLGTMMLPGLVMLIPNYEIMVKLGLVDSYLGLVLPAAFSAFGTFLLRQFMLGIPRALDEAAEIDGASKWQIFWTVIMPLSRPGLVTLAIFTLMGNYHSFFWPLVMMRTVDKYTLPVGLLFFDSEHGQATHLLMAAVTMSVVPLIVLFVLLQRQFIRGIQIGAVKG